MEDEADSQLVVPAEISEPYEKLLIQSNLYIHNIVQGILRCKTQDIKATKCAEMTQVLRHFTGTSPHKQKEALMEFLNIVPEFKTTDMELMDKRLHALRDELKRRGEITDLLIWAKLNYVKQNQNQG